MARILTGIQSTNIPHLGNILGAMLPAIELSNKAEHESLYFIADLHSLTSVKDAVFRRNSTYAVAAAWIALGFDTQKNILYRQSDVPQVTELTWYLSCITPFPMLENAHSFKDKSSRLVLKKKLDKIEEGYDFFKQNNLKARDYISVINTPDGVTFNVSIKKPSLPFEIHAKLNELIYSFNSDSELQKAVEDLNDDGGVNAGLFTYPVLMAADILMYDANIVPVGKDQKQHIEITRDIARSFNHLYGNTFVIPEAKIEEQVMIVPGTDGQKMSKSYNNFINIFLPEKELKKVVNSIITDSKGVEEPKDPDTCNVFNLFKLVAQPEQVDALRRKYENGGYGYGVAKLDLFAALMEKFANARQTYTHLMENTKELDAELQKGAAKATAIANPVLARVRQKLGFL